MDKYEKISPENFNARAAFGFGEAGYITIFHGNQEQIENWFREHGRIARYNELFHWYVPSHMTVPNDLPHSILPVRLPWANISKNDVISPYGAVRSYVEELIFPECESKHQGTIGERIKMCGELVDSFNAADAANNHFNHTFVDENGNLYLWQTTSTRQFTKGEEYSCSFTVKAHSVINGRNVTVMTYPRFTK